MNGLRRAGVELDRKALADLAIRSPDAFASLADRGEVGPQSPELGGHGTRAGDGTEGCVRQRSAS